MSQVWLVPFALFISLAANEQTLPNTAGGLPYGGAASGVSGVQANLSGLPYDPSRVPAACGLLFVQPYEDHSTTS